MSRVTACALCAAVDWPRVPPLFDDGCNAVVIVRLRQKRNGKVGNGQKGKGRKENQVLMGKKVKVTHTRLQSIA